jgi:hypothetical protein
MVLNRLQFSKLLRYSWGNYGILSSVILEQIMCHGRLKFSDIRQLVLNSITPYSTMDIRPDQSLSNEDFEILKHLAINHVSFDRELKHTFESLLISNRVIITVDVFTTLRSSIVAERQQKPSDINNASIKGNHRLLIETSTKVNTSQLVFPSVDTQSKDFVTRKKRSSKVAFGETPDLPTELSTLKGEPLPSDSSPPTKILRKSKTSLISYKNTTSSRHKYDEDNDERYEEKKTDTSTDIPLFNSDTQWLINWENFIINTRYSLCVQVVRERMGRLAGDVIAAMLRFIPASETNIEYSSRMTITQIHHHLHNNDGNTSTLDIPTLTQLLEVLRLDSMQFLHKV